MSKRIETKKIYVGKIAIGGDSKISVQSMIDKKTEYIAEVLNRIARLSFVGADIIRLAITDNKDAEALKIIRNKTKMPLIADIHFNHKLALRSVEFVDGIRINPGNIGSKAKVKEIVKACQDKNIPIRVGVNAGSLESEFENKYGATANGMVASADYNIKFLEDLGFTNIKISMKASDVNRTVDAYRKLRVMNNYPFHIGVTEAGTKFHGTIKSAIGLGSLLLDGIGDTLRVSITGELEEEILVGKAILKDSGRVKDGLNIISCPTCGRLQSDLIKAVDEVEKRTKHIKKSLNVSVMGCVVNSIGEAKHSDIAIAFGKKSGMIMVKGKVVAKLPENKLVDRFIEEIEKY